MLFEGIYKKVGKELSDRKKMMADVIEVRNVVGKEGMALLSSSPLPFRNA